MVVVSDGRLEHLEREVKLEAGVGFVLPDLGAGEAGERAETRPPLRLQAVYYDTEDLRLLRHGVTLRHRRERRRPGGHAGEREWTLKLPAPSDGKGLVRKELMWPGGGGAVPKAAAALVTGYARGARLVVVARLSTERRRTVVEDGAGSALVEVDDDTVSVMDGRRLAARFREVEVEVVDADGDETLARVVARLQDAGALPGDDRPKVARALGRRATEPPEIGDVELGPDATLGQVVAASIGSGYRRLVEHDAGVRLDEDHEDVHQARVATRRLRSDLRTFGPLLDPEWTEETRAELGWLAGALGAVRDADVLGERLDERRRALAENDREAADHLRARLDRERRRAHRALAEAMGGARYVALLDRLVAAALDPPLAVSGLALPGAGDGRGRPGRRDRGGVGGSCRPARCHWGRGG